MHADQRAAVERVREKAGSKGVEVLPEWFKYIDWNEVARNQNGIGSAIMQVAEGSLTGALAKWLAGQGCPVFWSKDRWVAIWPEGHYAYKSTRPFPKATNHLSALFAAATAVLEAMPDKEPPHAE